VCAIANAIQSVHKDYKRTIMVSIHRPFYLVNARASCAIFLHNWTQCIDGLSLVLEIYVRKGNDAKNLAILRFFFVAEIAQLNAAHTL